MIIGDVVYLKSSSRPMTVTKIDSDTGREEVTCDWDGGSKRYPTEALTADDPTPQLQADFSAKLASISNSEATSSQSTKVNIT